MEAEILKKYTFATITIALLLLSLAIYVVMLPNLKNEYYSSIDLTKSYNELSETSQGPVLGIKVKIVNVNEYVSKDNNMEANIKIPEIRVEDNYDIVLEANTHQINKSIQEYAEELISMYKSDVDASDGEWHQSVNLDYDVITDSDRLFSIRFNELYVRAGGNAKVKIFHVDKQKGQLINLQDLFHDQADYKTIISDNIKEQMRQRMEKDKSLTYWLNSDVPKWDFQNVTEDTTFYINKEGKLVIVFDEYEVAPGFMGLQEFEIPQETIQDIANECRFDTSCP